MMVDLNYQKRKNVELFKSLEDSESLFLSKTQNYIPIYKRFFELNDTNWNSINLNHKWYISSIKEGDEENSNLFNCKIKNINTQKTKEKDVFFKLAPLLDPYKYLIGKYDITNKDLFNLPDINSDESTVNSKFLDQNNSAYVDGFFIYLSSNLNHTHNFLHGLDYYGSFLSIKNNYKINIFDDLEYLTNSDFFNKNKNVLFEVNNYDHLFQDENKKKKPIKIEYNSSTKSNLSIKSFDEEIFEEIFENNELNANNLKELNNDDLIDMSNSNLLENSSKITTIKSSSTCSSRTSHTSSENSNDNDSEENVSEDIENIENIKDNEEWEDDDSDSDTDIEETIEATIPQFPVQVIGMEYCENTFDDLILSDELKDEKEWFSAFMQIIMILITYQKTFAFTHNDLHTNNVMYNTTDKKYLFYCYKKKYYKVPTFGRIFKIIDFGRSIYKYNGKIFCSDSFQNGGDAATQYNTEPYFNDKKPRLEPNYSFDLCRLACSIFDYLVDDLDEVKDIEKCEPVKKLIVEWCLDDKGINLLYKNNGVDRYPDFKLYKMIARCVHRHTPQAQLERPEFKSFEYIKKDIPSEVIDIDSFPSYI
jgi:negative regulator of replication initiation